MTTAFEELQAGLVERHRGRSLSEIDAGTIVVIPAITYPPAELVKITGIAYYEERMLFTLLLL